MEVLQTMKRVGIRLKIQIKNNFMAPAGLYAVLRSRRTYPPALQGKLSSAALRGTCFYPWRSPTTSKA